MQTTSLNTPLTDAELQRLSQLIDRCYDDGMGPPLEFVDGLLSAVVVSPAMIMPSDYLPVIFGEDTDWSGMEDAQEAMSLIARFNNQIASRIALPLGENDDVSEEQLPLMMLPEVEGSDDESDDSLDDLPADFPFAAAWADGFLCGADLREDAFEVLENELDWLADDLDSLAELAQFGDEDDDPESASSLTLEQRFEKAMQVPHMLHALLNHRQAHDAPSRLQ